MIKFALLFSAAFAVGLNQLLGMSTIPINPAESNTVYGTNSSAELVNPKKFVVTCTCNSSLYNETGTNFTTKLNDFNRHPHNVKVSQDCL